MKMWMELSIQQIRSAFATENDYSGVNLNFCKKMSVLAMKNKKTDDVRQVTLPLTMDDGKTHLSLDHSRNIGRKEVTLKYTMQRLKCVIKREIKREKRAHLHGIISCG